MLYFSQNFAPYSYTFAGTLTVAGRGSSIGSVSAWHASDPEFDPHLRYILSWILGHENISTVILPLPLIQEEQSVNDLRLCLVVTVSLLYMVWSGCYCQSMIYGCVWLLLSVHDL